MDLKIEIDPAEVGFAPDRLARIDHHFERYVADGRLAGWSLLVSRGGQIVHIATCGQRDLEAALPVELDTLWRIFSMTKPITSVAAMMLYEEGAFELKDPVSTFIPSFADMRVYRSGSSLAPVTEPATEPVRVWHLLTHTAGLTYGFHHAHPVDAIYRAGGYEWGAPADLDLAGCCDAWASFPLLFQPGTEWNYSVASDVLGRVVEVASGQRLDEFFRTRIFEPLGMSDTAFSLGAGEQSRLAALYTRHQRTGRAVRMNASGDVALRPPSLLSGGGGLVSSARDYHRFTQMLLGEGALDGVRLLGSRTLRYMTRNHLPGGADVRTPVVRGDDLRRRRIRTRILRRRRSREEQGAHHERRVRLGRCREHGFLGRSRRTDHRAVLHPAPALEHLSHPPAAQATRVPITRRLVSHAPFRTCQRTVRSTATPDRRRR